MSSATSIPDSGKRVGSTARSIAWSFWWRRLASWLFFDLALVAGLYSCFHVTHTLAEPDFAAFATFVEPYLPVAWAILGWELIDLLGILSDVRRVRRKLQPLQDLALAAETYARADLASFDKIETLEQAVSRASVDSPRIATGDQDLRSIEVALNGLLRQMQEAKLQQMRFVSDASHELRTPIAVIQGYVNMLARWGKSDEKVLDESVEALRLESEHMQELVEQLLFLARGDSGRNTLQRAPFNLAAMMHEVWEESCMIDADHVYLCDIAETDASDPRFAMVGDLAMVKQSARVIVQNAAKYSPAGSTVRIGAAADTSSVSFTVQDEGIGMSEEAVAHIFDRFYRADNARDEGASGSGLGLSIAKWIVDAHGGRIDVVSREGVGTRFTVRFTA